MYERNILSGRLEDNEKIIRGYTIATPQGRDVLWFFAFKIQSI
jgi:hypothetical protein